MANASAPPEEPAFEALVDYIRTNRGFDFTGYKRQSLNRRFAKRLSRTTFIDSTGLRALVAGAAPATTAALTSAGLTSFFSVSPTVADAVALAAP